MKLQARLERERQDRLRREVITIIMPYLREPYALQAQVARDQEEVEAASKETYRQQQSPKQSQYKHMYDELAL